ncbi:MAG: Hemolysin-type calcium-binding repeat (2 copies) [Rhodobacteraceae bacterium HLUCCA08]|nr:MAG: Hemolysin-type calcium-binding repeat (2 copies) [Rhodobacteraceae bacterium HLUCCA08]
MTTYSFTGIIWTGPDAFNATSAVESTFELVVPDTTTGFTYSLTGFVSEVGLPIVDIDLDAYSLFAGGNDIFGDENTETELLEVSWNDGADKTAWLVNVHDPVAGQDYLVPIGGDALPSLPSLAAFLSFVNSVTVGPANAGTGFEPGDVIPLSGVPGATVTENDTIFDRDVQETLFGGLGDDTIYGGSSDQFDSAYGGEGDDVFIQAGGIGMRMYGGPGDDTFNGNGASVSEVSYQDVAGGVNVYLAFNGTDVGSGQGRDSFFDIGTLIGSNHDDRLIADKNGTETIRIYGQTGNDIIKGGEGDDLLYGGFGNDVIRANGGDDLVVASNGDDTVLGLSGDDDLYGGLGSDYLYGNADNDILYGAGDDDFLRGNRGNDTLYGEEGNDDLRGGGQQDILFGGDGNDYLLGENGLDTLDGGAGDDVMIGGYGAGVLDGLSDTFVYVDSAGGGGGYDRIKDFEDGIDVIDLTYFGFTDFATEIEVLASDIAAGMRINFGSGDVLLLEGFSKADFDAGDVLF